MKYEYKCDCGCLFEEYRTVKDRDNVICPDCKNTRVKRQFTTAIAFKGSGFYINNVPDTAKGINVQNTNYKNTGR